MDCKLYAYVYIHTYHILLHFLTRESLSVTYMFKIKFPKQVLQLKTTCQHKNNLISTSYNI